MAGAGVLTSDLVAAAQDRVERDHRKTEPCTEEEFAHAVGRVDVTGFWKGTSRRKQERQCCGGYLHQKEKRYHETAIFEGSRQDYWAIRFCDVIRAETKLLQSLVLNIDFGDVWKWVDFVCDAPHTMGIEVTRAVPLRNTRRRTRLGAV